MYQEQSLNAIIDELDLFYKNTGLKTNYDKSVIYKVGSAPSLNKRMYLKRKFKWSNQPVDTLGLIVGLDGECNQYDNYASVIDKASSILKMWQRRQLSLVGKIEIVNALVNSLFTYKMQVIPALLTDLEARVRDIIVKFIWNAHKPKIRTEFLYLSAKQGGRKLAKLSNRDKALKIKWVQRLHCEDMDRMVTKLAYHYINSGIKNALFWECNFNIADCKQFNIQNPFWKSVVDAWSEFNYRDPQTQNEIQNQVIWYNSNIKIGDKMVLYQAWFNQGIYYIKDLMIQNRMYTFKELREIFGSCIQEMQYNSLISAIPIKWKKEILVMNNTEEEFVSNYGMLEDKNKWSQFVYARLNWSTSAVQKVSEWWSK